ncbi:hypothetical protein M5D96_006421 [Drosophila gunungcola]|uniref:Uncharacterized protein n=1 Tax=Drosophila gunungcola TaxID=103775 RepID=A0A9P9YPN1_9MUSC|nr:hypothetical protein M5D96_006421 [Drosophila gunungcola]
MHMGPDWSSLPIGDGGGGQWLRRRGQRLCKAPVEDPKITQKAQKKNQCEKMDRNRIKRLEASFCLTECEKTLAAIGCPLPVFDVVVCVWHVNGPLRFELLFLLLLKCYLINLQMCRWRSIELAQSSLTQISPSWPKKSVQRS